MKRLILLMVGVVLFTACVEVEKFDDDDRVNVVVTVGMLGDLVRNVGGDFVQVIDIMGPGVDPHMYKPSTGDISLLERAEMIFYVGRDLEAKMAELFRKMSDEKVTVSVVENLDEGLLIENDPHIWFDVALWSEAVEVVVEALAAKDPENADSYRMNGDDYLIELMELEAWVRSYVKDLEDEKRVLITAHDAFGYFGRAYGFEVLGVQGISTASDFGLKDLEDLIDVVVDKSIKAIFVESSVSDKSIRALMEGVRANGWEVLIGGELYSDAMGDASGSAGNYVGMVKHNVTTIVDGLK